MKCSRRKVLVGFFSLAAGGAAAGALGCRRGKPAEPGSENPRFSPAELRTISAALERVLPGALEAGVPDHMAYWVARDRMFANVKREFALAVQHLDRVAREAHGKDFAACAGEAQDGVLRRFQRGEVKGPGFDGAGFFGRLVTLALEGFLGDPKYGGNRGGVGWRFIGFKACWWSPKTLERIAHPERGFND